MATVTPWMTQLHCLILSPPLPEGLEFPSVSIIWFKPSLVNHLYCIVFKVTKQLQFFQGQRIICPGHMCFTCQVTYMGSTPYGVVWKRHLQTSDLKLCFQTAAMIMGQSAYCKPFEFRTMFAIRQRIFITNHKVQTKVSL